MTGLFGFGSKEPKELQEKRNQLKKMVKSKNYEKALRIGEEILEKKENDHDVLFVLGSIFFLKGKYQKSITYFEKTLKIGSYDPEALLLKANSHFKLGEIKNTKFCCEKIEEIDPKNKGLLELKQEMEKKTD